MPGSRLVQGSKCSYYPIIPSDGEAKRFMEEHGSHHVNHVEHLTADGLDLTQLGIPGLCPFRVETQTTVFTATEVMTSTTSSALMPYARWKHNVTPGDRKVWTRCITQSLTVSPNSFPNIIPPPSPKLVVVFQPTGYFVLPYSRDLKAEGEIFYRMLNEFFYFDPENPSPGRFVPYRPNHRFFSTVCLNQSGQGDPTKRKRDAGDEGEGTGDNPPNMRNQIGQVFTPSASASASSSPPASPATDPHTPHKLVFGCLDIVSEILRHVADRHDLESSAHISSTFRDASHPYLYKRISSALHHVLGAKFKRRFVRIYELGEHEHSNCLRGADRSVPVPTVIFKAAKPAPYATAADTEFQFQFQPGCHMCDYIGPATRLVIPPQLPKNPEAPVPVPMFRTGAKEVVTYIRRGRPDHKVFVHPPADLFPAPAHQTATLVLLPHFFDAISPTYRPGLFHKNTGAPFDKSLFEVLARHALWKSTDGTITIVGLEDANPYSGVKAHWKNRATRYLENKQAALRKLYATCDRLEAAGPSAPVAGYPAWSKEQTMSLRPRLRFITFKEYLESGAARDDLHEPSIEDWLWTYDNRDADQPLSAPQAKLFKETSGGVEQ